MNSARKGWYVDPSTGTNLRFWSGNTWTDEVAPLPPEMSRPGLINFVGVAEASAISAQDHDPAREPVPSEAPVPAAAEDGSREGGLDPDIELTLLTRRERRARRGIEAPADDAAEQLAQDSASRDSGSPDTTSSATGSSATGSSAAGSPTTRAPRRRAEHRLEPPEEIEIPGEDESEPATQDEQAAGVGHPRRSRRIMRLSLLFGVLAVASSVAILTAGTL